LPVRRAAAVKVQIDRHPPTELMIPAKGLIAVALAPAAAFAAAFTLAIFG
jgi:hypothetical protein